MLQIETLKKFENVTHKKMPVKKFEDLPLQIKTVTAGISACTADLFTFPLDTVKVRLQVQGESKSKAHYSGVLNTILTIAREEGPKSLYNGLIAGLQRQMFFASIRLGLYETVKLFYQDLFLGENAKREGALDVIARICAGVTTGAMAVVVAQPTDVVKVRFQAQSSKEIKYSNTTEAYKTIYKEEGFAGLWKGSSPNIARNAVVNVSEIVCYDLVKGYILNHGFMNDHIGCHFTSAVIAGFCATVASSPVDVIKTRYMNSPQGQYSSAIHCAVQTFKNEGFFAFYKGFTPSFTRLVAWNIVLWITYEKLKVLATNSFKDE